MEKRQVGRTDLAISRLGLGCVTLGREIDEDTSYSLLDYAVHSGINWFDTAEAYGGGNAREYRRVVLGADDEREVSGEVGSSEKVLGRWLRARECRSEVLICTKVSTGNRPENIRRALGTSLERLQTDYIDIYKLHNPDDAVPIAESMLALNEAKEEGLVRCLGCSNFSALQLREALEVTTSSGGSRMEITQPPYSLALPEAQDELFPLCRNECVAATIYSPLGAGFLAGKYTPDRESFPTGSRFDVIPAHADDYFSDRNFRVVEALRRKADELGQSMVGLAMAWAMSHVDVTSVLVGARSKAHIDNALAAAETGLDSGLRSQMTAWN